MAGRETSPTTRPSVRSGLSTARMLVAVSVLGAPVATALLLAADGRPWWPTIVALMAGLVARAVAPASTWPLLALLCLAPLWQVAVAMVTSGGSDVLWVMPWLAALAGCLAWPRTAGWRVSGAWQLGVAAWALVLSVAWPVTALRELDFTLASLGAAAPVGSFGPSAQAAAAAVALAAEAQLVALLLFDWACGAPLGQRRQAWLALAPGVALACGIAVWQQGVDPAFLSREPWITLDRGAGPFFDANAMGALAALFGAALARPGIRPLAIPSVVWSGAWVALAVAGTAASGSRTALAALVVGAVGAALATMRGRQRLMALVVAAALLAVASRITSGREDVAAGNAATRLLGTVRGVLDGGATAAWEVVWRRNGYGPASMATIADHPWVGVGPGAFGHVISDYAKVALGSVLPPDNAQNWWRQQLADLGLIGSVGPILCSLLALGAVLHSWRRLSHSSAYRTMPLAAAGLMAVVSPPSQHPVLQVLIGLLVADAVAPLEVTEGPQLSLRQWRPAVVLVWITAAASVTGLAWDGWTSFRPPQRAARFHFAYTYGLSAPVQSPFGDGRWSARRSVAVFPPEGPVLVARVVLPHDDLARRPVVVTISDGNDVVCRHEGRDHAPFECRLTVPDGRWPLVQVDVSRTWRTDGGTEQAALVSGRFER